MLNDELVAGSGRCSSLSLASGHAFSSLCVHPRSAVAVPLVDANFEL